MSLSIYYAMDYAPKIYVVNIAHYVFTYYAVDYAPIIYVVNIAPGLI